MAKPIPEMPSSVFVALVGRPNVGKSSLTNYLVGEKVAIVTKKPQTTRSRITGVITKGPVQYVLMDTPGIHAARNKLDARMTQTAAASLKDVDVTMMLFEPAGEFTDAELTMVKALQKGGPAIAVINKVDLLDNFAALEARKKEIEDFGCFDHIVTISAKDGTGCDDLFAMLKPYGNEGPHYFDDDAFTDMPEKELVAELVREKALLFLREEVPHGIAVVVERFKERPDKDLIDIDVDIYCERKSHKGMIIGKGGQMLKKIASAARMDIEELLGVKVNLQCWVKVREDWRDNELQLNSLGFAKPQRIFAHALYSANIPAAPVVSCCHGGDGMDNAVDGWRRFAQTGSIYDYLTYKTQQNAAREDVYANCNNGSGAAPGQGGGGRPDPDDPDA